MRDRLKTARPVARLREGRADWYSIQTNKADGAAVYIYDEIGYFGITAADFVREFAEIDRDRISVHLNSPGGEVYDGIAIYEALRQHEAQVTVYIDSLAASIASVIAQGGDHRIMARNATMMIHEARTLGIGSAAELREQADRLDATSDNLADIYAERCANCGGKRRKRTVGEWRELMLAETWFTAAEALEAGLVDEVSGTSSKQNSWDLSIFNYSGRAAAPAPKLDDPTDDDIDLAAITDALRGAFA